MTEPRRDSTSAEHNITLRQPGLTAHLAAPVSSTPSPALVHVLPPVVEKPEVDVEKAGPLTTSSVELLRQTSREADLQESTVTDTSDYFSPGAFYNSSTQSSTCAPPPPTSQPSESREFVESARSRLYREKNTGVDPAVAVASQHPSPPAKPQRSHTTDAQGFPQYPDQSHSALHLSENISHSTYHVRHESSQSQPTEILPPEDSPRLQPQSGSSFTRYTSRTAGNTPALTPSLFSTAGTIQPLSLEGTDEASAVSSPYLHPTQVAPPRVTRSAQRDIDFLSGRKMINRYEILGELGRGVHGKVKYARNLDNGEHVAIKVVQRFSKKRRLGKASLPEDTVKKEIAILKKVQHPNVVRLIEVIDDPEIAKVYIVLEYCEQRELVWRTEGEASVILKEHFLQGRETNRFSPEIADSSIAAIDRRATRRKARTGRKRLEGIHEGAEDNFWSLTYTSDSDEDLAGDESTTPSEQQPTDFAHFNFTSMQDPLHPASSRLRGDSAASANQAGYSFYGTEDFQPDVASSPFPSPVDLSKARQSSVATTTSALSDRVRLEIPDDFRYVPTMTLDECRSAFRDAVVGLEYLHYNGIIHRDIKPDNLLRTSEDRVKISDFGVSYLGKPLRNGHDSGEVSETEPSEVELEADFAKTVGTPAFFAPEICRLDAEVDAPIIKAQIDIWALGTTLFCLVFARLPFEAPDEFAMMRRIAEEEIYIPRLRLIPTDPHARVRSPGHGPLFKKGVRNATDFTHEPIDDELFDLMKRLFKPDPTQRITIAEIKRHPWVLRNLNYRDPSTWIAETDPGRMDKGRKIEVSTADVEQAVAPISTVERIKSLGRRALSVMGVGGRRKRGQGSATSSEGGSITSIPDQASKAEQYSTTAIVAPVPQRPQREQQGDHPLSRSVTASPGSEDQFDRLEDEQSISPMSVSRELPRQQSPVARPKMPGRHASELSTAASIRTLRASDFERGRKSSMTPPPDETAGRPEPSRAHSRLRDLFEGQGRSLFRAMRSKEGSRSGSVSPRRSSQVPVDTGSIDEAPAALMPELAAAHAGRVESPVGPNDSSDEISGHLENTVEPHPDYSRESLPSSGPEDLQSSRPPSIRHLSEPQSPMSRSPFPQSSQTASTAPSSPVRQRFSAMDLGGGASSGRPEYHARHEEPSQAEYTQAKQEMARRRAYQDAQDREHSESSRPSSSFGPRPCPPSPDDEHERRLQFLPPTEGYRYHAQPHSNSVTSSEDPSASDVSRSRSTSFPSVPSAISENSSLYSDTKPEAEPKEDSANSSEGTTDTHTGAEQRMPRIASLVETDDGYTGDRGDLNYAVESEPESESDDDDFLTMSRHQKFSAGDPATSQIARTRERRETALAERKSSRSGSTNTMKKVRTRSTGGKSDSANTTSSDSTNTITS